MRILLFGATGMVGQGVLRACLTASDVDLVQTVGRTATGIRDGKLREIIHPDLFDEAAMGDRLACFDACFFCLGVSSSEMNEEEYVRLTFDLTTSVAETLAKLNPAMTFVCVSGSGTDSSEKGPSMWARVKGRTENALLRMPFRQAYMFRPGLIVPLNGIQSKVVSYFLLSIEAIAPRIARSLPQSGAHN